jgi:pimeloyl-ACP methyl ester carboxylesterase
MAVVTSERDDVDVAAAPDQRRWWTRGAALVLLIVVVVAVAPPVWTRAVAFATVADGLDLAVPRPFAPAIERDVGDAGGVEVDRYGPEGWAEATEPPPAIVVVPGAAPSGRQDTRVVALSEAIARAGRVVVVPELEVYDEDLVPADIDRIGRVVTALAPDHGQVVMVGVSFGGSLSLVAAADPAVGKQLSLVATFGAYADLGGVVQAATTGVSLVDGDAFPWAGDPRAADVVRDQVLGLLDDDQAVTVAEAFAGEVDPDSLPDELRAVHDLLVNDDPARTPELLEQAPSVVRDRIEQVSPAQAGADLEVPLIALHAIDDPVIPYGELARLASVFPHADPVTLTTFDHVGVDDEGDTGWWVTVQDLWRATGFVSRVLTAS